MIFLKYDAQIYRPPKEARSLLLQVTNGCSHNKCKFCGMYKDVKFAMESLEQIEADIVEASQHPYYKNSKRVFLLNGNAFILKTERLLEIANLIHKYIPSVEVVAMYASIKDIEKKSDQELKMIKEAGISDLYIGVESGNQEALEFINKGNTVKEAIREMKRLDKYGYYYYAMVLTGLMGQGSEKALENGRLTGEMLSQVNCRGIFPMSVTLVRGTELWEMAQRGEFKEASEYDRLIELKSLIENLKPASSALLSSAHNSNTMFIKGILPRDREEMLAEIEEIFKESSAEEMQNWIDRRRISL